MRQRDAFEQHRIRGVGAGAAGAPDQIVQQVDLVSRDIVHQISRSPLISR